MAQKKRTDTAIAAMTNKSGKATRDVSGRTDSSGKKAGDVGYESALAKRARLAKKSSPSTSNNNSNKSSNNSGSKYSAGKGRTGNSKTDWSKSGSYNKGGLMKKKKK